MTLAPKVRRDKSIRILDAQTLAQEAKLPFEGNPKDSLSTTIAAGFYTNLEDKDRTLPARRLQCASGSARCGA